VWNIEQESIGERDREKREEYGTVSRGDRGERKGNNMRQ